MKTANIEQARDPMLPRSFVAIRRAAQRAWEVALRTNTALIVAQGEKLTRVYPGQVRDGENKYTVMPESDQGTENK
jgi:hypothetical protein